jgi:UDP-N-acetylmuramyl pentapeptide phosphotransferase/UDP-N-acetylglucosamine-1-phosphate transferase
MKTIGIVLIIAGILMLIFRGFSFTKEKKVVDLGPVEINKKEKHDVGWPVYAGGIAIFAGVIVLVAGRKSNN